MGLGAWGIPLVWAQTTTAATNPNALAPLALRRWCGSLTLSSPETVPSWFGLWAWLAGLAALLFLAAAFQGPGRALRQLLDVPGLLRLVGVAIVRLRRSGRLLAVTIGATVLSWTAGQTVTFFRDSQGKEDLLQLIRSRSLTELGVEQGVFAALTPLRDVAGLGGNLPLVLLATVVIFRASADLLGGTAPPPGVPRKPRISGWANLAWPCLVLVVLYRVISILSGSSDLPLGGCLMVEALVIPVLMALADGVLLAWVLVELRNSGLDDPAAEGFDVRAAVGLLPGAILASVAALPARQLASAVFLASLYLPTSVASLPLGAWLRWALGTGLAEAQAGALTVAGIAGAVAWSRGSLGEALRGYGRLLRAEGGRLVGVFGIAGLTSGVLSGLTYIAVLSLPTATWLLHAADSYAHYATLPIGLWTLSALVELGERSLPEATLAATEAPPSGDA